MKALYQVAGQPGREPLPIMQRVLSRVPRRMKLPGWEKLREQIFAIQLCSREAA